jgi:hypothetical protein
MQRIAGIALTSVLVMGLATLTALGDHGRQSNSKSGGKGPSNSQPQGKSGGKQSTHQGEKHKGHEVSTSHPKNPGGLGKKPGPHKPFWPELKNVAKNPNVGPGAQAAINTINAGNFLSSTERQDLTELVVGNPAKLSEDELKAVQAALDYDALAKREEQYLKLENATGERLTVWLHYQSLDDKQALTWFPVKPVDAEKALRYVLEPNATMYLGDGEVRIAAARARVWAESDSGRKWQSYRDTDLKMKPTERESSRVMGTYSLRLVGDQASAEQARK